jgi:hypothetical protein
MGNNEAGAPAEVRVEEVQQQTLRALQEALDRGDNDAAHCLAGTYESLVHAETMEHHAVRAHVERELRRLEVARSGAAS